MQRLAIITVLFIFTACEKQAPMNVMASAQHGRDLYTSKACSACHSIDGSPGIAPTLKGLYQSRVELKSGPSVIADEVYLRESIREPSAKVTKGFPSVMPKLNLLDYEVESLVLFIKSLGEAEKPTQS